MSTSEFKDTPLKAQVEDGELVVRIGLDRLAWSAVKENNGPLPKGQKIVQPQEFAEDVVRALEQEDDLGNSMLNRLIDKAIKAASNEGSTGIEYPKTERRGK